MADAVLRGGSKHSNDGDTATEAIRSLTRKIRKALGEEVPIIVRMDAGFCDQKIYRACEELGIGYVSSGRLLGEIKDEAEKVPEASWAIYRDGPGGSGGPQEWAYHQRGDRRGTWSRFRRMIYTRLTCEKGHRTFDFARKDTIIYTNLGLGGPIDRRLKKAGKESLLEAASLIELHHDRGRDELVHRALKDFGTERMPFQDFFPNMAFYSTMLLAFNLYEAFKEDGLQADEEKEGSKARIPLSSYARRLRREVIDIAGKLVRTAGRTILKVTEATSRQLSGSTLKGCSSGSPIHPASDGPNQVDLRREGTTFGKGGKTESWSPVSELEVSALIGPKFPLERSLREALFTESPADRPRGLNGRCQPAMQFVRSEKPHSLGFSLWT